jgi:WD40 repeat protein
MFWSGENNAPPTDFTVDFEAEGCICVTAGGDFAFLGGCHGEVIKFAIENRQRVATFEGHSDLVSAVAITSDARFCVSGGLDKSVRLWAVETGQCLAILRGHTSWVHGLAITPDARRIASVADDGTLRVWDIPESILARAATSQKRGYVNAKVVLVAIPA